MLIGPPSTGKSLCSDKLSKLQNISIITIKDVLDEFLLNEIDKPLSNNNNNNDDDPYAEYREAIQKYRDELEIFINTAQDKKKKDKKANPERPKLSDEIVNLAYQYKLKDNSCINKGFILDN